MTTRQLVAFIISILLSSCQTADNDSGQETTTDTGRTINPSPGTFVRHSWSLFSLDTTVTTNFDGDTGKQISNTLKLVADFDKASMSFRKDTFSVFDKTTEGCEIIVVHDTSAAFVKLYGTLFGEIGKTEFRFYLPKSRHHSTLSCAIFTDISYDRHMVEKGMKIKSSVTTYEIYTDNKLIAVLDSKKDKQNFSAGQLRTKENETRQFFKTYIGQIKIVK